jgi:hypothetical protein
MAFDSSAQSSPLPAWQPNPEIVSVHVTRTLPVWMSLSFFMRVTADTVETS